MRGYAMGAVDYVFKPVDPIVLKSKVGVFVDLYLLRQQVEEQGARRAGAARGEAARRDRAARSRARAAADAGCARRRSSKSLPLALYEAWLDENGRLHRRFVGGDLDADRRRRRRRRSLAATLRWCDRIADDRRRRARAPRRGLHRTGASPRNTAGSAATADDRTSSTSACRSAGGDRRRWVGTLIDVTAQRELEAAAGAGRASPKRSAS